MLALVASLVLVLSGCPGGGTGGSDGGTGYYIHI
jgi:hypothetical protein